MPSPLAAAVARGGPARALAAALAVLLAASLLATAAPAADADEPFRQDPLVCTTAQHGLGQPLVDNQDGEGIPVAQEDADGGYPRDARGYPTAEAQIVGWSRDCDAPTQRSYLYKRTTGQFAPLADPADLPADAATTTTTEGRTVPYVVRLEKGVMNRFIYSVAMLAPVDEADPARPDTSLWNRRALFSFSGGVAIGHTQGSWSQSAALLDDQLGRGYAVLHSTGLRTNTHYNLVVGGETAVQLKDHLVATYGAPDYTVAVGGSGGAIQQYAYAQNHPGLLDGAMPQYSYPDMVTQTIHIGDCELLQHYMERTDAANTRWRDIEEREKLQGLNSEQDPSIGSGDRATFHGIYQAYQAFGIPTPNGWSEGNPSVVPLNECRPAWFGLLPLAMNPTFTNVRDIDKLAQGTDGVEWTHWADGANVYGVDEEGWARVPWDNVGVQYGLEAVRTGAITPEEFLHVNAYVGGWKHTSEMVAEGFPFAGPLTPASFDPWSSRNMNLSPGGTTPAPRTEGDVEAIRGAFENGHVFRGDIDIPVIDWRHYLEHELDMHNSHQSFAARQRMRNAKGESDNQLIWFTDARPARAWDQTTLGLDVLHEWITNIQANPDVGVAGNKPAAAVDSCFATDGTLIHAGEDAWDGVLDDEPAGPCTKRFELHGTSRTVAGAPITGEVFKCRTMPVRRAVGQGLYGDWQPTKAQVERLEEVFPEGVCDYSKPGIGEPPRTPPGHGGPRPGGPGSLGPGSGA